VRQHLTVYHINDEFTKKCEDSFEPLLRSLEDLDTFDLTEAVAFDAQLFVSIPEPSSPSWVDFLREGFDDIPEAQTQSPRAVLFLRIPYEGKDEIFAFTFGHGRYLINPKSYDTNYGLRTALNAIYEQLKDVGPINPSRLRSVSARTIASNPIRTRRQADRKATFETFGIDIQRDLVNAVTGMPMNSEYWGTRMSGADSLSANPEVEFTELGEFCKQVTHIHKKETYKQEFEFIENLNTVTDEQLKEDLIRDLVETLVESPQEISLTVPEIIDFDKVANFGFSLYKSKKDAQHRTEEKVQIGDKFVDPDDADLSVLREKQPESKLLEAITERWYMEAYSNQGEVEYSWPLINCLTREFTRDRHNYILSEGEFFEIGSSFLRQLNRFVRSLPKKKHSLVNCCGGISEEIYNKNAAGAEETLLCMDRKTVRIQDDQETTSSIEVCDLLTEGGCFIHVKKNYGSSALSHLFAQGSVSADLLLRSTPYREATLQEIKEQEKGKKSPAKSSGAPTYVGVFSKLLADDEDPARVKESINPRRFEIAYAIIDDWGNKSLVNGLPFFSKVNLRKHVEYLRRMGYKVSVACVDTAENGDDT
jgi:uncharacterized protein (TIGR04141 family)